MTFHFDLPEVHPPPTMAGWTLIIKINVVKSDWNLPTGTDAVEIDQHFGDEVPSDQEDLDADAADHERDVQQD